MVDKILQFGPEFWMICSGYFRGFVFVPGKHIQKENNNKSEWSRSLYFQSFNTFFLSGLLNYVIIKLYELLHVPYVDRLLSSAHWCPPHSSAAEVKVRTLQSYSFLNKFLQLQPVFFYSSTVE